MANPVLSQSAGFNGSPYTQQPDFLPPQAPGGPQHPGQGAPQGYQPMQTFQPMPVGPVMTFDDVITKTALMLLAVFAVAAATFMIMPLQWIGPAMIGSGIAGLITVFIVASRRKVPVAGVAAYAIIEGIFIGAISKFFEFSYPGIVVSAVLATFVTAAATLAAYKFFNIRVTPRFRKFVSIGTMALLGVVLVNFVLSFFGVNLGVREIGSGAGMLSILVSVIAVALAVFNLVIDFDFVERGVAAQLPAHESWRAAFGITVTLVWLYIEILRILSYFRD